jgi:hypothetical protein
VLEAPGHDNFVGWVVRLHDVCQELGGQKVKMVVHWLELTLLVKVIHGSCCMAASYCAHGVVLSYLNFVNPGFADDRFPERCEITDDRHDGGFVGHKCILHGEAPGRVCDGLNDFSSQWNSGQLTHGVGIVHAMRIKDYA